MPHLRNAVPKIRKHKSGQASVRLNGKDFYLGKHGSKVSRVEYDRLIGLWLAAGRSIASFADESVSVTEICIDYVKHCTAYYRDKSGKPTAEVELVKRMLRRLRKQYGDSAADDFGPLAFSAFRQTYIDEKLSRRTINRYMLHLPLIFKHAVSLEKIPVHVFESLKAVSPLRKNRSAATEGKPIPAVDQNVIDATIPHLTDIVAAMVKLQLATAMRPAEVCLIRPCDVVRTGDVWIYEPSKHKTEHKGKRRIIPLGPKAQEILTPFLLRGSESFCFSPAESMKRMRVRRNDERKTPMSCGNRRGSNRKQKPKRLPGDCYTTATYRRSIAKACDKHALPRWSPNQIRKRAATDIRKSCSLEAAQVILGHSSKSVTEAFYAEVDTAEAFEIARKIG